MPELPEVETVCRGLKPRLKNHIISEIEIINPKLRIPIPKELPSKLKNKKILEIKRKAKYILIEMEQDLTLVIHLGMSGRVILSTTENEEKASKKINPKHTHLIITLDDETKVIHNDTRKFGLVTYIETSKLNEHRLFNKLGLEPFSKEFTAKKLEELFARRNKSIKSVLMDSSIIVGIGNIYASEILFKAKVHPERNANTLTTNDCKLIHKYTLEVLDAAIKDGGSSLRDYIKSDGVLGRFQHHFLVYGKTGKPCSVCSSTIKSTKQGGRTSFYCLSCQN